MRDDFCLSLALATVALLSSQEHARATNWGPPNHNPAPCGTGGQVVERAPKGFRTTFELVATDCQGRVIPGSTQTQTGAGNVVFTVPGTINGVKVGDYRNHTIKNEHVKQSTLLADSSAADTAVSGAESYLNIESLYQDPGTGQWSFEGVMAQILFRGGGQVNLRIPDLYADTNGDGLIGQGDVLYSWVDVRIYPGATPDFQLGDTFEIINGQVTGLPGMWFSATEIYLDPLLGPQPTGGVWFNAGNQPSARQASPLGGHAEAWSEHELTPQVPEPSSGLMAAAGLLCWGLWRINRQRSWSTCWST